MPPKGSGEQFRGKAVRVFGTYDDPLFVAVDVCEALEIKSHVHAVKKFPASCKGDVVIVLTLGGTQEMATITEAGLYRLVFKSRKAQEEEFNAWETEEVLPAIRETGRGYGGSRGVRLGNRKGRSFAGLLPERGPADV